MFHPLRLLAILALLLFLAAPAPAQERHHPSSAARGGTGVTILSIIPASGEAETTITLSGTGFTDESRVFLGTTEIPAHLIAPKQLAFDIPELQPGLYALFIRRADGTTSRSYPFTVLPLRPEVDSLSPDTIIACTTGREREVAVTGSHFLATSRVLFDGAAIRTRFSGPDTLLFDAPQVAPGLHKVQVQNQQGTASETVALMIDGMPEITSVSIGDEYVNSYNLVIEGKNFRQGSTVVVTEESSIEQGGTPQLQVTRIRTGDANATDRDRVVFSSCTRLVYQRYPYSSTLKSFQVQVVNPNGDASATFPVTAP